MTVVNRWTTADLDQFPDNAELRYEIVNGELHVSKAPNWYHQLVAERISRALGNWNQLSGAGAVASAPGIILEDEDNLIPDVIWISNQRLATALHVDGKLHALPELIVEVLSPGLANIRRDREDKPDVYARNGVLEYWLVDWQQHALEVYRNDGTVLQHLATLTGSDTLRSPLLSDFEQSIASLFAGVPRMEDG